MIDQLIFGGSFNPVHNGHLKILSFILKSEIAGFVNLAPASVSPFKSESPPAAPEHRIRMLEIAVSQLEPELQRKIRIAENEIRRPPPAYTAETCREFREEFPGQSIGLLVGSDSFLHFDQWKNPDEILRNHPVYIFYRPGVDRDAVAEKSKDFIKIYKHITPEFILLENPPVDCSSTQIREYLKGPSRIETGAYFSECLPVGVLSYIQKNSLYNSVRA